MNRRTGIPRFAMIGYGAIAEEIVRSLESSNEVHALCGALVRANRVQDSSDRTQPRITFVEDIDALLALDPAIVVECAGHEAVREHAAYVLGRGVDVVCISSGALADARIASDIARARRLGAQLWIPSGAVAGIDGIIAARTAGLRRVSYTCVKAPHAWRATPGERTAMEAESGRPIVIFEGSAREAALRYPRNANVAATVALAGLGLDRTMVRLVSDSDARGPLGVIEAEGDFGAFRLESLAYASLRNSKTSTLTAHSIVAALREGVCFAARLV